MGEAWSYLAVALLFAGLIAGAVWMWFPPPPGPAEDAEWERWLRQRDGRDGIKERDGLDRPGNDA